MTRLTRNEPTLPSSWYYDREQYRRELDAVWYREWVCVGRQEEIPPAGGSLFVDLGAHRLVVTRDSSGRLRAKSNAEVRVDTWGGFVFVNLAAEPSAGLRASLGDEADALEHWPLKGLRSVHREQKTLACNWKVFWENYSECYHCPGLHPELCRVVPLYRKGVLSYADLPGWQPRDEADDGRPTVASGLTTWTLDGRSSLPAIEGLDERSRAAGMAFASFTASMFVVGHPDYVRSVRLLPRGPESVELAIDWLLPAAAEAPTGPDLERLLALGRRVIEQDGAACELNQRGLHSRGHRHGVLVPQEYEVWAFHEWLRQRLSAAESRAISKNQSLAEVRSG